MNKMLLFIFKHFAPVGHFIVHKFLTSQQCDCDWNAIVTSDNAFFGQKTENNVKVKVKGT